MATRETPVTAGAAQANARPCFFHRRCGNSAEMEKQGKTLCRPCGSQIAAEEFPLRAPTREPLYWSADDLVRQLDMQLPRAGSGSGQRASE